MFRSINPATEELLAEYEEADGTAVGAALSRTQTAFAGWRRASFAERATAMRGAARNLRGDRDRLAGLMTLEMGKPIREAQAEIEKCAWACEYFAENAEGYLRDAPIASAATESYVTYQPLGTVFAIMPWNFPFWQVFRFAAPSLMAGNTALVKHAPSTPQCALAIAKVFHDASFPEGVFENLFVDTDTAARIIGDERIAAVTLTGSDRAGSSVAATSGRALKKTVLELGGSDAFVVLGDADVDRAAEVGVRARCLNSGQSCIAAKRFVVHAAVYDAFRDVFVAGMRAQRVGDPRSEDTAIGPLARRDLRDLLTEQVDDALAHGARALLGGERPSGRGFFSPPTVLEGVGARARAYREELFGPVACLYRAGSDDEALALANATDFGLGASVWTRDPARAERFVGALETGSVFVNGLVKSDPRLPFGGVKESGYGRELGVEGVRAFVNVKTVWVG